MLVEERESTTWTATIGWTLAAVVLFVLAMLLGADLVGYLSFLAAGAAVATGVSTYKARLRPTRANAILEQRFADLQARLEEAETEIARLRSESDFDRKLTRPRDDSGSAS
jgi:hypothetical protein